MANREISPAGVQALALQPAQWRHGETDHFIVHYRSMSDVLQVGREIEFHLWYVAQSLGALPEQYARKSHLYIFRNQKEWLKFLDEVRVPAWVHSFASRDDLFLELKAAEGGFDSQTLAHETTHAIVARIYGNRRWPLWLGEGFAEYMGEASVAARNSRSPRSNQRKLQFAEMTVAEVFATKRYPEAPLEVARLYATSAKLVRYLFDTYSRELFPKFVALVIEGRPPTEALLAIYGKEFSNLAEFEKSLIALIVRVIVRRRHKLRQREPGCPILSAQNCGVGFGGRERDQDGGVEFT